MYRVVDKLRKCSAMISLGVMVFFVSFTADCVAQNPVSGDFAYSGNPSIADQVQLANGQSLNVEPGETYTFNVTLLSGPGYFYEPPNGSNPMGIWVFTWPGYSTDNYGNGPIDTNISLTNFQYISPTQASFTLSVASGAPKGVDQLWLSNGAARAVFPLFLQPPSPPTPPTQPPQPPQPSNCGTPQINSVTPSTWIAGQTYPITITGSNFVTPAMATANSNCTANQLSISVPTGSITLSDFTIIDSNKITATVQPAGTDPTETATLTLWGNVPVQVLVAKAPTGAGAIAASATPMTSTPIPPGMQQVAQTSAWISPLLVQAQNVTPTLNLKPEQQAVINPSVALMANLTLGGTFQIALAIADRDGTIHTIPSSFSLGTSALNGDLDPNALFSANTVFQYTDELNNAAVFQSVHLGTQQLTITPNDPAIPPVSVTLSVENPASLGSSHTALDRSLYPLAHETGLPPQMIKGQVKTEGGFNPKAWRYEPLNAFAGEFAISQKPKDYRTQAPYSSLRLPTIGDSADPGNCGANYNFTTHVDSRIPDPNCRGFTQGGTFSEQVMSDIAQASPTIMIPERDPNSGAVLTGSNGNSLTRPLSPSDRYVSVHDVFIYNDSKERWTANAKNPARVALVSNGAVDFSSQLSLASSYGLLQVTYVTALDQSSRGGQWTGNNESCGPSDLLDPDNLFDTSCNLAHNGGSLGIGTRITERNFVGQNSASPSVANESALEALFVNAYQRYDPGKTGYGSTVISNTRSFEPNPTGTIFGSGEQQ